MVEQAVAQDNPGTSTAGDARKQSKEISDNLVLTAEQNKAIITAPRGKDEINSTVPVTPISDPAAIDNTYFLSTCHLDEAIKIKAYNGKFLELQKLLPNPKRYRAPESRTGLEFVKKDGYKYLVQHDQEDNDVKITNVKKWDEAFRIYAALYTKANPTRGAELMQYMHTIHLAASSFVWDNVLYYDYCFRNEMSDHPERSWATTNTQMWSLAMRDALPSRNSPWNGGYGGGSKKPSADWKETLCWKFNRNKCFRGTKCRFDHKCSYCGSPQHNVYNCPKKTGKNEKSNKESKGKPKHGDSTPSVHSDAE